MNENAMKWIEALRSGEYSQTQGTLSDKDGFCCLGVACKVYESETGNKLPVNEFGTFIQDTLIKDYKCVREWIGLSSGDGEFQETGGGCSLTELNDTGKLFHEIADLIESEPLGLFK